MFARFQYVLNPKSVNGLGHICTCYRSNKLVNHRYIDRFMVGIYGMFSGTYITASFIYEGLCLFG